MPRSACSFDSLKDKSPKWRNHHRYVLRGIIKHAIRNHWTPKDHDLDDLLEDEKAVGKKPEIITPEQFSALLQSATSEVLPMIAIGGFAGARTEEILRLCWEDVIQPDVISIIFPELMTEPLRMAPLLSSTIQKLAPAR